MANFFGVIKMANIFFIKMANFLDVIKMANFCVIKMANFFYQNGELFLLKWRISFYSYSQNGELFALVKECLIGFTQKSTLLAQIQNSRPLLFKKVHFFQNCLLSRPVAVHEPS